MSTPWLAPASPAMAGQSGGEVTFLRHTLPMLARARPLARAAARRSYSTKPSFSTRHLEDDDKPRQVCDHCGFTMYANPTPVGGVIALSRDGRVLLGKRDIEPQRYRWGLPAGYVERGESVAVGSWPMLCPAWPRLLHFSCKVIQY